MNDYGKSDGYAANSIGGYGLQPSKSYVDQAIKQTAVHHATQTLSCVKDLALRLEGLAESICGAVPVGPDEKGLCAPQPSGILPMLQYASEDASDYISRANRAIDRINSFI